VHRKRTLDKRPDSIVLIADIASSIARLDPGSFTAFAEALLAAEVGRLGIDPWRFTMSNALTENDAGLDARLVDVPALDIDPKQQLPPGLIGLQLKSTRLKRPGDFRLPVELRKAGPTQLLLDDGTYVLVSSQELNPDQRAAIEQALVAEALRVLGEHGVRDRQPRTLVWDATTLSMMSRLHPGPAIEIGVAAFGRALSLSEVLDWLRAADRPYELDPPREEAVRRLRERATTASDDPTLMMLHGDAGAGKTRTIAHALDTDELRDQVIYVNGAEDLEGLLARVIRNERSRGILFIDEVDDQEVTRASARLGGLRGRWRVVSAQTRGGRGWIAEGGRNIVLPPLEDAAMQRLLTGAGLPQGVTRMVAEVAAGFPELAFRLADELKADPSLDLVRLSHLPAPQELLSRALPDAGARLHIAPLALFAAVGFDDELAYELDAVAATFAVDTAQLRRTCDEELRQRRFISRAGRYRMVSPKIVAIWLASDLIGRTPDFDIRLETLPASLVAAFVRQLDFFGPDAPHLPDALRRILANPRFRQPADFTEAAGRFMRAAAAIVPNDVAAAISELIGSATNEELTRIPRRDLVWTIQVLLWWEQTWNLAIDAIYALARHENESWANNATGVFVGAFPIFLSGSTVGYAHRIDWLDARIRTAEQADLPLLLQAALAGLQTHHVRTVVGFQGGGEPRDWAPQSQDEYRQDRLRAWQATLAIRDKFSTDARDRHAKTIAGSLRAVAESNLHDELAAGIRDRHWSVIERAELAAAAADIIRYSKLDEELTGAYRALRGFLIGTSTSDRIRVLFDTPIWKLYEDVPSATEPPEVLRTLAGDLVVRGEEGLRLALSTSGDQTDEQTRFVFFRILGEMLGASVVGDAAFNESDWTALRAAASIADATGEAEWANRMLERVARENPAALAGLVSVAEVTDARLDLALGVAEREPSSGSALAYLAFGARVQSVGVDQASRLACVLERGGHIEGALSVLRQWVTANPGNQRDVEDLAFQVARTALETTGDPMTEFELGQLVKANAFSSVHVLALFEIRMTTHTGLSDDLDMQLLESVLREPAAAAPAIFKLLRSPTGRAIFGGDQIALLSALARAMSPDAVWAELETWTHRDLLFALHNMDWRGDEPEDLVRRFLLSNRLTELEGEAFVCFFNTLGVVMGPFHLGLEKERERARHWRTTLRGTTAEGWAGRLVERYDADIALHRRRDEEDDLLYR
jgi:hypothetical protein